MWRFVANILKQRLGEVYDETNIDGKITDYNKGKRDELIYILRTLAEHCDLDGVVRAETFIKRSTPDRETVIVGQDNRG